MRLKLLRYFLWHGGRWYLRRRYGALTSRRVLALGVVGTAVVVWAIAGSKRPSSSP